MCEPSPLGLENGQYLKNHPPCAETTEEEEEDVEELRTEIAEQAEYISKLEGMLEEISRKGHESEIQKAEEVVQEGFHLRHQNQLLRQELDFARESARSERVEFQAQLNALRRDLQDAQQGIDMEQNTTFVNALAGTAPPGELRVLRDQNRSLEEELESLQAVCPAFSPPSIHDGFHACACCAMEW